MQPDRVLDAGQVVVWAGGNGQRVLTLVLGFLYVDAVGGGEVLVARAADGDTVDDFVGTLGVFLAPGRTRRPEPGPVAASA